LVSIEEEADMGTIAAAAARCLIFFLCKGDKPVASSSSSRHNGSMTATSSQRETAPIRLPAERTAFGKILARSPLFERTDRRRLLSASETKPVQVGANLDKVLERKGFLLQCQARPQ
jgi:hypothetical protein